MGVGEDKAALWTDDEAAAATGGRSRAPWRAHGVSIDSRTVAPGDLFVALQGPNFDGHGYLAQAQAKGAVAALVSRIPEGAPADLPLLVVGDTFEALYDLGRAARARSRARVLAITGSVGKTSTKEALACCLAAQAPTYATAGSLNNHWGVPLSLARLARDCVYGVFELGMNHAGEIGPLARLVQPQVGVITTIAPAHMEFFASLEAIADAKAELFEGMAPGTQAVLNRDNPQYQRLATAAAARGLHPIWSFGHDARADARVLSCELNATGSVVAARIHAVNLTYTLSSPGAHWVMNSLAVLLAVHALGGDVARAAATLEGVTPVKGRGTRQTIHLAQGGAFTLIDESYNASPAAMAAALQVLGTVAPGSGGRRVAVLGDMRELGDQADRFHAELWEPVRRAGVARVFCVGRHMAALYRRVPEDQRGEYAPDSEAVATGVAAAVRDGDVVLVKGSAGSRMAHVVAALRALDRASSGGEARAPSGAAPVCEGPNGEGRNHYAV